MEDFKKPRITTRGDCMATSQLTITLTDDQQRQFREATGQTVTELTLEPAATNELSDQQLDGVVGGSLRKASGSTASGSTATGIAFVEFTFKLVTVKTP